MGCRDGDSWGGARSSQFSQEPGKLFYIRYISVKCAWAKKTHLCKLPIWPQVEPRLLPLTGEGLNILKVVFLSSPTSLPSNHGHLRSLYLSETPFSCASFPVAASFFFPMLVPRVSSWCSRVCRVCAEMCPCSLLCAHLGSVCVSPRCSAPGRSPCAGHRQKPRRMFWVIHSEPIASVAFHGGGSPCVIRAGRPN